MRRRWFPLLLGALALAGACASDAEPVDPPFEDRVVGEGSTTTLLPPIPSDPPAIEGPSIGTLSIPCGRGGEGARFAIADRPGVDGDTITIGTGNDRGGLHTFDSGRVMPDAVEAMAGYCNELGGLLGREVLVREYDAAVVETAERVAAQCDEVIAVVGQGYLRADDAATAGELCELPTFEGWLDDLTVGDPVVLVGYLHAASIEPAAERVVLVGPDTPSAIRANENRAAALQNSSVPAVVVATLTYPVDAPADWDVLAQAVRDADAGLVRIDGACASAVVPFVNAFAADDALPLFLGDSSAYDHTCISDADAAGVPIERLLIELPFHPVEDGDAAPVTARYAELLDELAVEPTGDAFLAASAFWRFAVAVDSCDLRLGRTCLSEASTALDGWTAGGLHRTIGTGLGGDTCVVIMGIAGGRFERRVPEEPGVFDCDPSLSRDR